MAEYFEGKSGPSTNYAQTETRTTFLSTSHFAMSLCESHLGLNREIVEALVGRYMRGKRKGLLRGFVRHHICTHGGWESGVGVIGRGIREVALCVDAGWSWKDRAPMSETLIEWQRNKAA